MTKTITPSKEWPDSGNQNNREKKIKGTDLISSSLFFLLPKKEPGGGRKNPVAGKKKASSLMYSLFIKTHFLFFKSDCNKQILNRHFSVKLPITLIFKRKNEIYLSLPDPNPILNTFDYCLAGEPRRSLIKN